MIKVINNPIKNHFMQNIFLYLILTLSFTVGVCTGTLTVNAIGSAQKEELTSYLQDFFNVAIVQNVDSFEIFKISLVNNIKFVVILWIFGITIIGIPLILIFIGIKGFIIGFTVGFLINYLDMKGAFFSIISILPQSLIMIPCYIILGVICISYSLSTLKNNKKTRSNKEENQSRFFLYSTAVLIILVALTVGSIIEAYITPVFIKSIIPTLIQ